MIVTEIRIIKFVWHTCTHVYIHVQLYTVHTICILQTQSDEDDDMGVSQKGVPQGYEAISLIEALNGPCFYNKSADPKQRLNSSYGKFCLEIMPVRLKP